MEQLNASQREAVCHRDGPALVLAGPGSGKTAVIMKRLQHLVTAMRIPPEQILVVTFTRAAAQEMRRRFEALLPGLPICFGTFHSIYYRILTEHSSGHSLTFLEEQKKKNYLCRLLEQEQLSEALLPELTAAVARLKNGLPLEEEPICKKKLSKEQLSRIFHGYVSLCKAAGTMEYDDMAYACLQLLKTQPGQLALWQKRFQYILVDEYQDTSPIQEELLSMLAFPRNNVFLVGDEDQAIYGFRGAGTDGMLSLEKRYPGLRKIELVYNYRSRPGIIQAAGLVIAENEKRFKKQQLPVKPPSGRAEVFCRGFMRRTDEYEEILRLLRCIRGRAQNSCALLFRRHADAAGLCRMLEKQHIPYRLPGQKMSMAAHEIIADITAYFQFVYGERRRADFYRIMNRPDRGILRESCSGERVSFQELLFWHRKAPEICKAIAILEQDCQMLLRLQPYGAFVYLCRKMGYEAFLQEMGGEEKMEEKRQVLYRIQELLRGMSDWKQWIAYAEEVQKEKGKEVFAIDRQGAQELQIMTYHGAKGLEFDHVILPGLNEGHVPHKKAVSPQALEEERRMLYVAMTRARESLHLYYLTGTKEEPEEISRFLNVLL